LELEYNQTPKKWRQGQMRGTKKLPSKCKHQDRAKRLGRKILETARKTLTLNFSTITTGCFQMTKVLSVNDSAKVWEVKKVAQRFVISHQHKKVRLQSLQALPGLTLTKSATGAGVDCQ
jgi:hypothetical protein